MGTGEGKQPLKVVLVNAKAGTYTHFEGGKMVAHYKVDEALLLPQEVEELRTSSPTPMPAPPVQIARPMVLMRGGRVVDWTRGVEGLPDGDYLLSKP